MTKDSSGSRWSRTFWVGGRPDVYYTLQIETISQTGKDSEGLDCGQDQVIVTVVNTKTGASTTLETSQHCTSGYDFETIDVSLRNVAVVMKTRIPGFEGPSTRYAAVLGPLP